MQKLYYSITEVSSILDEESHILRYWEKEFPQLNPKKNRAGNRIYSDKDLELLQTIKHLIRVDMLSLKGAKEYIAKYGAKIQNESTLFPPEVKAGAKPKNEILQNQFHIPKGKALIDKAFLLDMKKNLIESIDILS